LFYTSGDSFAADAVILTGSALHAAFIVIGLLALSSGLEGIPGLVIGCATMVKETRLAVENFANEATLAVRHRGKEKSPTAGQAKSLNLNSAYHRDPPFTSEPPSFVPASTRTTD
jgi:hypothetical protein